MHRSVALAIVALALILRVVPAYAPYTFLVEDGTFYANVNRSLTENGTFRQDATTARSWYFDDLGWNRDLPQDWSNVALGVDDRLYPKHPVLMPLAAEPFYAALGLDGLLLFNLGCVLLAAWFALGVLDPRGERPLVSAAVAATCLSPTLVRLAYGFSNDVFAAVPLIGGALALATGARDGARGWRPFVAGAALAGAVWARPVHGLAVLVIAAPWVVARLRERSWGGLGRLAAGFGAVLAIPGALQWAWYGSPFVTGYDRILVREHGVVALDTARAAFTWPGWGDWWRVVVTDESSFVRGFPLLALVPLGWVAQVARGRWGEALASGLVLGGASAIYAGYAWPSSRFLVPFLVFLAGPLAALLEIAARGVTVGREVLARWAPRGGRVAAWGLAGLGVLLAAGGVLRWIGPRGDAGELSRARVSTLDGRPCDFWNLKWQRWECSHLDRDLHDMVGVPQEGECDLPGSGWVRLPASGPFQGKALEVARPAGATALEWTIAADPAGRPKNAVPVTVAGLAPEARVRLVSSAAPEVRRAQLAAGAEAVRFAVTADPAVTARAGVCLRWAWR